MAGNLQSLTSPDVFTRHPPQYTDSFILLIKAVMLFGRVTDFNVRGHLRASAAQREHRNPFELEGFKKLDSLVSVDFLENLPPFFKNKNGITNLLEGNKLDTDLYMVHLIPHAYVNFRFSMSSVFL